MRVTTGPMGLCCACTAIAAAALICCSCIIVAVGSCSGDGCGAEYARGCIPLKQNHCSQGAILLSRAVPAVKSSEQRCKLLRTVFQRPLAP